MKRKPDPEKNAKRGCRGKQNNRTCKLVVRRKGKSEKGDCCR